MARPTQDAIDMFVNITGASEAVAVQKLEEHNGDLNEAVNAHFSQGDRMSSSTTFTPTTRDDFMDIDDPINAETAVPALPPFSAIRRLNQFSVLESHFGHGRFDDGRADFISHAPRVSHPRNVREIPIEFKDESPLLDSSGCRPKIEDVTGSVSSHEPEVHGTVIIDDDDDDDSLPSAHGANHSVGVSARRPPTTSFSSLTDVTDYTNDIEEEMIQAAIEASKREAEEYGKQQYDASDSLAGSKHDTYVSEDSDLAHAVSLSLKTAERESFLRTQGENPFNAPASRPEYSGRTEISGGPLIANERQELEISKPQNSRQSSMNETDSSFQDDVDDDVDKEALRRSKHAVSGNTSSPSSSQQQGISGHAHCNGNSFQSDEWGGLSTEEHDEAVMLEAAMFGGAPQGVSYEKFAYPHHPAIPTQYDRAPYPPSPRLAEQRLLREQQDDEYLASLHADREKELKAMQVAEKRRLEEAAAIEAALRREKNEEEEAHRKQLEEEEFERKLAAKQASLPGEPSADNENSVTLLIRMPDGSRCGRRFLKSDKLQLLYDYLDVGRLVKPGSYKLVRPYPRRPFANEESQLSLSDLGLTSKQEALFLELI